MTSVRAPEGEYVGGSDGGLPQTVKSPLHAKDEQTTMGVTNWDGLGGDEEDGQPEER